MINMEKLLKIKEQMVQCHLEHWISYKGDFNRELIFQDQMKVPNRIIQFILNHF